MNPAFRTGLQSSILGRPLSSLARRSSTLVRPLLALAVLFAIPACRTPEAMPRADARRPTASKPSASELTPAASATSAAQLRVFRVRAYVDADYQAQTPNWEQRIRAQFEWAKNVTKGELDLHLELVEVRRWERDRSATALSAARKQLIDADPGADVDWVVGYVSSLPGVTTTVDELGVAEVMSRHAVLRGIENPEEGRAIEETLVLRKVQEREPLYRQRKLHKEAAILLHQWAHALGAIHERATDTLMSRAYSLGSTRFSDATVALLEIGLAHWPAAQVAGSPEQAAWRSARRARLEKDDAYLWQTEERAAVLGIDPRQPPGDALTTYAAAKKLTDKAEYEDAAERLAPWVELPNPPTRLLELACEIAWRRHVSDADIERLCGLAMGRPESGPEASLNLARFRLELKDLPGAIRALRAGEQKLRTREQSSPETWGELASLYLKCFCVTWAEDAAAHADQANQDQLTLLSSMFRSSIGLRRASPPVVPPDQESAFVAEIQLAGSETKQGQIGRGLERVQKLTSRYPKSPVAWVALCDVQLRAHRIRQAHASCTRAVKLDDAVALAHLYLGKMAPNASIAAREFNRADELDSLVGVMAQDLYRERFGADLPRRW